MSNNKLAFSKINYIIMLIGIAVLVLGFFIMTLDTEPYGFGFLGLTLGPIVVILGFVIEFVAILYKAKQDQ
ncbi:DUF3098 domain-containing protein [Reichenbachiella agarivorans]|uniref:DUF3098 domain-containing protein n=1 Tax=Reichenbachiella agarivorans TaxID=2979464 RepID=A0ABY6CTK4_9BACT|nr:DUF3098 domain-containing protein [Reichenbachiella agarivorans]UXP33847.1 DUF3098 domain-containing protein [Reichenbachiella agarivorans]